METIHFAILIRADKQKVWNTMLEDQTYREWTKEFHVGSFYKGNWEEGSEIHFIALDNDGKSQGMYSRIVENTKYQFISIEHLGLISNGIVDTTSEQAKEWAPSYENYTFTEAGDSTELTVEMQVLPEYKSMFEEMWPRV